MQDEAPTETSTVQMQDEAQTSTVSPEITRPHMKPPRKLYQRVKVCYLLALVLFAQLMIPALLLQYSIDTNEVTLFCPNSADGMSRALAFAIGCIYQVRIILLLGSKLSEPVDFNEDERYVWLRLFMHVDSFMNITYARFVYFLDMWIVFVTEEP